MLKKTSNNIVLNLILLMKNNYVKWVIYLCVLITMFFIYSNTNLIDENSQKDFYTTQLLLFYSLFGVIVLVVIGSFIGAKDLEYLTYNIRLINSSRSCVFLSKVATLFILSFIGGICYFSLGVLFDLISNNRLFLQYDVFIKVFIISCFNFFWALMSSLIAYLTRSFSIANMVIIIYIFVESFFLDLFPIQLLKFLPMWNEKVILNDFFQYKEGIIAIILQSNGDKLNSLCILFFYLLVSMCVYYYIYMKRELN